MFNLKTVVLKASLIGRLLSLCVVSFCAALWFPSIWVELIVVLSCTVLGSLKFRRSESIARIHIEEQKALLEIKDQCLRLEFVRANSIQIIARVRREKAQLDLVWPSYRVIYYDSVEPDEYRFLRSFAAQDILLRHKKYQK